MSKVIDITGQTFGRLTVIERDFSRNDRGRAFWKCQCTCGNVITAHSYYIRSGGTQSCGCYKMDKLLERSTSHNMRFSSEYSVYCAMKARCYNPKNSHYHRYGGRGITICQEWLDDFMAFYNHIGPRPSLQHSIDRIDNSLGYMPGNVKWSNSTEQANNKSNIPKYTCFGKTLSIAQWSRETGFPVSTLMARLKRDWPLELLLTKPLRITKRNQRAVEPE